MTQKSAREATENKEMPVAKENFPAPTGNIDDTARMLVESSTSRDATAADEEADAESIKSDSQEVDDFGQSYDEATL